MRESASQKIVLFSQLYKMSFYKIGRFVLSSYKRVHLPSRTSIRLANAALNTVQEQTTSGSTLRILQPCPCCKLISVRHFSTSNTTNRCRKLDDLCKAPANESNDHIQQSMTTTSLKSQKLRSWSFTVNSFDCINIKTNFDVIVKPVSPLEYPAADHAFVTLALRHNSEEIDNVQLDSVVNSLEAQADYTKNRLQLAGNIPNEPDMDELMNNYGMSIVWHVEVPISFDADIKTFGNGNILLENLENHNCTVHSEHGNCYINKVKSDNIKVSSLTGHVISKKVLQGNAEITTHGSGTIIADRLQGQTFLLRSEAGLIHCKDIYAAVGAVVKTTTGGDVELRNVHADCEVTTSTGGSVQIDSLEGSLKATTKTGDITAFLVRHKEAHLTSQHGNITVNVPSDVNSRIHLQAPSVTLTPELKTAAGISEEHQADGSIVFTGEWNQGMDSSLHASTQEGSITVAVQSWFDSLKLNK